MSDQALLPNPFDYEHNLQIGHLTEALQRYVRHHLPVGHFLTAVLSNDLKEACGRADYTSIRNLGAIVSYCYNELPANAWGSPEKVEQWLAHSSASGAL